MNYSLDLVIPVLNEEETLEKNIKLMLNYIQTSKFPLKTKIIIADNGSIDQTQNIGQALAKDFPDQIKYIKVHSRGVGLALKEAWLMAQSDFVGYMDLDLATDINHLKEVAAALLDKRYDFVYGTRLHEASNVQNRTLKREITSRVFNFVLKTYLRVGFSDGMCGFKFLKTQHVKNIVAHGAQSNGWFFCTEILVVSEWIGLKIYELPVKWTDDPNSKVNIKKLTIEYLKSMYQLKQKRQHE